MHPENEVSEVDDDASGSDDEESVIFKYRQQINPRDPNTGTPPYPVLPGVGEL